MGDIKFYYIESSIRQKQNELSFFAYVKTDDSGYDYYIINLYMNDTIECDVSKISNIFAYVSENKIKVGKTFDSNENENLYKYLIKELWNYIFVNGYSIFDLQKINFDDGIRSSDIELFVKGIKK